MIDGHTQQSYICLTTPTFVYLLNNTHIFATAPNSRSYDFRPGECSSHTNLVLSSS